MPCGGGTNHRVTALILKTQSEIFAILRVTQMFLNALLQYNSTVREIFSNIRFNWTYKPLSDFFLVYNQRRSTSGEVVERALIAKLTYVFDFWCDPTGGAATRGN